MGFWTPIDNEEKRARWIFLGGGLAAIAAASWAVFTYVNPPKPAQEPTATPAGNVTAAGGSAAAGRDMTGVTINPAPSTPSIAPQAEPTPDTKPMPKKQKTK